MEEASPTTHLVVLLCNLVATIAELPLLYWQYVRFSSFQKLCQQPQTWAVILKCISDSGLVTLRVLDLSQVAPLVDKCKAR